MSDCYSALHQTVSTLGFLHVLIHELNKRQDPAGLWGLPAHSMQGEGGLKKDLTHDIVEIYRHRQPSVFHLEGW